jgi:chromosome segregation ATPase
MEEQVVDDAEFRDLARRVAALEHTAVFRNETAGMQFAARQLTLDIAGITATQAQHTETLNEHTAILNQHTETLNQHTEKLNVLTGKVDHFTEKMDVLGDLSNVLTQDVRELRTKVGGLTSSLNEVAGMLREQRT